MSRVIDAVLRLRDEFTQPLEKSINLMTQASKAGDKTRRSIEKFGNGIAKTGATLTAAITVPVIAAGTAAVKTASDFESGMAQVQATMGITKDATTELNGETVNAMDALEKLARDLGKDTIFSASEAAAAMNNLAMAGYDIQEIYDTLPTTLNLAAAGSLELDEAARLVTNGMATMGDNCDSVQQMVDMLAVTATSADGSVAEFGEGLLEVGAQASITGQSLADTYTALGILGDNGIHASESGNMLQRVLKNIYQDSASEKIFDSLGVSISDAEGNMLDLQTVLQQLNGALDGMTEKERSDVLSKIFDVQSLAGANALLANSTDRWDKLSESIAGASDRFDGAGAAAGMAATLMDTPAGRAEKLSGAIEELALTVGDILMPFITQATEWLEVLADKFNSLDDGTKENIVKFALMAAAAGPLIAGFGKMIVIGSKLLGVFSKVRGVMAGMQAAGGALKFAMAALTGPIGIVVAACAGIAAIVAIVITHLDMFKAAAARVAEKIAPSLEALKESFTGMQNTVGPVIDFIGDLLANVLVGAFEGAADGIRVIIDGLTLVVNGISDTVGGVVDFVKAIAEGDWKAAWDSLLGVAKGILETLTGIIEGVAGVVAGLLGSISGAASKSNEFIATNGYNTSTTSSGRGGVKGGGGRKLPGNAAGTTNWRGGWTRVNEKGGEIMNLPSGTQIIPHDASRNTPIGGGITIAKLADSIIVREDADIDKIGDAIVRKIKAANSNRGGLMYSGSMA